MTEPEWLASEDPAAMLGWWLGPVPNAINPAEKPSRDRKLRLYACACVRQVWGRLTDAQRVSVVFAEQEPWHQSALGGVHPEFLSQDAITTYTGHVGDAWAVNFVVQWLGAACEAEVASQAPAWLQRVMPFRTQAALLRDVVGNPFRPVVLPEGRSRCPECVNERFTGYHGNDSIADAFAIELLNRACNTCNRDNKSPVDRHGFVCVPCPWLTPDVVSLATAAYDERGEDGTLDPVRLAVLADALEEAGCCGVCSYGNGYDHRSCKACGGSGFVTHPLVEHLRSPGPHYRGCWALDCVLGRS